MSKGTYLAAAVALGLLLSAWQPPAARADNDDVGGNSSGHGGGHDSGSHDRSARYCVGGMSRKVIWATATAGGRNCAAACRGFNDGEHEPFKAVNTGSASHPSFLCRASDASFNGKKRAGYSSNNNGKATPCYGYANGGPIQQPMASTAILAARGLQCGCVADRKRWQYSGCPAPVWKTHAAVGGQPKRQTSCRAVCEANGHRNAVEDTYGQSRFVCRPGSGSSRIGWAGFQEGLGSDTSGTACHFVSRDAVSGNSLSVYSFSFQCMCI